MHGQWMSMRRKPRKLSARLQVNYILILEQELQTDDLAQLSDARARYAQGVHELTRGLTVACIVQGKGVGHATVLETLDDRVTLQVSVERPPPPRTGVRLLVAIPRPQTVKKLLQLAASAGVERLDFVRTHNVVKSYLQSKALLPENIRRELIIGMEQAGDPLFPVIEIHQGLESVLDSFLLERQSAETRFLADAAREGEISGLGGIAVGRLRESVILAIGPESGWTDVEKCQFLARSFKPVSLGPRMYRVETATAMLLGQIELIRRLPLNPLIEHPGLR